jgi:23S rRNA (pseudouridine1915-N3)-methyltransferase
VRVVVAVVGRPKPGGVADAIADYEARAARYWPLAVHEVREATGRSRPVAEAVAEEGERLLARLRGAARVLACDPGGAALDSRAFAALVAAARDDAEDLAFVIGGAHGLAARVRERAERRLALAPFTLPHELARLVLAEQLYRAGTIIRGEPYHK